MRPAVGPDLLRQLCKEPLSEVESIHLRGRHIRELVGLDLCPNLTALDISRNSLTELDSARLEQCKELWIVDASHNQLEHFGGLSSLMAVGYLDLSHNPISGRGLRSLASVHIVELRLGRGRSYQDRQSVLRTLPNVWVLDEEYVTAEERYSADKASESSTDDDRASAEYLLCSSESIRASKPGAGQNDFEEGGGRPQTGNDTCADGSPTVVATCRPAYRDVDQTGHRIRKFYENVIWKLPCRTGAADSFKLSSLLKHYDQRVTTTNRSAWLSTFTHGSRCQGGGSSNGDGEGSRDSYHQQSGFLPLPRSHSEKLQALPLQLKLDVVVLLAVRASFRQNIPQQVLAESLMVLLVQHKWLPHGIHTDLSRIPPFVCTALVHLLRSDMLRQVEQASGPGRWNATNPALLDRAETDLLEALPPVVTGIKNAFERQANTQQTVDTAENAAAQVDVTNAVATEDMQQQIDLPGGRQDTAKALSQGGLGSVTADFELSVPHVGEADSMSIGDSSRKTRDTASMWTAGESVPDIDDSAVGTLSVPSASEHGYTPDEDNDCGASWEGTRVGLTRLCRRAVILLTRSPSCPDLVKRQTGPAKQRMYDVMAPLLEVANMGYNDLHPKARSYPGKLDPGGHAGNDRSSDARLCLSPTFSSSPKVSDEPIHSEAFDIEERVVALGEAGTSFDEDIRSADAGGWYRDTRIPIAGEQVQVLHGIWSVIVATSPAEPSISVADFPGMDSPPYQCETEIDSRALCYDPRGWWNNAPVLAKGIPTGSGRLYRPSRGLSSSGLPWGAGSLNAPLEIDSEKYPPRPETVQPPSTPRGLFGEGGARTTQDFHIPTSRRQAGSIALPSESASFGLGRRSTSVVDVFSAEASWDPVFVVAPTRLVGLQNEKAVRERGTERARRAAWHRIDGPEAHAAPTSIMPRCVSTASVEASARRPLLESSSIPGLRASRLLRSTHSSPLLTASCLRPDGSACTRRGVSSKRPSSTPSPGTSADYSVALPSSPATSSRHWLELQREMGSLKAENRIVSRRCDSSIGSSGRRNANTNEAGGSSKDGGSGNRTSLTPHWCLSLLTNSLEESTAEGAGETSGALAKVLSLGLDTPVSAWRGIGDTVGASGKLGDASTSVFEMTQVHDPAEKVENPVDCRGTANGVSPNTINTNAPRSLGVEAGSGEAKQAPQPECTSPQQRLHERHRSRRDACGTDRSGGGDNDAHAGGGDALASSKTLWKPNVNRPRRWFPVPGRQVLLLDPGFMHTSQPATDERRVRITQPCDDEEGVATSFTDNDGTSHRRERHDQRRGVSKHSEGVQDQDGLKSSPRLLIPSPTTLFIVPPSAGADVQGVPGVGCQSQCSSRSVDAGERKTIDVRLAVQRNPTGSCDASVLHHPLAVVGRDYDQSKLNFLRGREVGSAGKTDVLCLTTHERPSDSKSNDGVRHGRTINSDETANPTRPPRAGDVVPASACITAESGGVFKLRRYEHFVFNPGSEMSRAPHPRECGISASLMAGKLLTHPPELPGTPTSTSLTGAEGSPTAIGRQKSTGSAVPGWRGTNDFFAQRRSTALNADQGEQRNTNNYLRGGGDSSGRHLSTSRTRSKGRGGAAGRNSALGRQGVGFERGSAVSRKRGGINSALCLTTERSSAADFDSIKCPSNSSDINSW